MRIIHTADWHIGQSLNGWGRDDEHRAWFRELTETLSREQADALLVSGDVFDNLNPSGESQRLLYDAIRDFREARPNLQIIMTSGNHDPAGRLEAPDALLRAHGVRVVGTVRRQGEEILYPDHLIRLRNADGADAVIVAAVPFLRASDLPGMSLARTGEGESPIVTAVRNWHSEIISAASGSGLPLIGMGHLTCTGGLETEGSERRIMIGGEHAVSPDVFGPEFLFVALGHLHMPQLIDGGRIGYSGSCFPMSVSEAGYRHGVRLIEIEDGAIRTSHIQMTRPAAFIRFPENGHAGVLEELAGALDAAELDPDLPHGMRPFLHLRLAADRAAASLLSEAHQVIAGYPVRLADIRIVRVSRDEAQAAPRPASLRETSPEMLFVEEFRRINMTDPEERHMAAFRDAVAEV
ncbi:exonuclease subunit SbcD [Paracoccus sp. ME4]|uniref:exonuclease subunit SbcD n=1 Tax=Paracoccus sp. ME4 TaxID=3138066 RepID=UPI00398AFE10